MSMTASERVKKFRARQSPESKEKYAEVQRLRSRVYRCNLKVHKPWIFHYRWAKDRCENPSALKWKYYGGKGIRMFLSLQDVEFLYKRDNAVRMEQASLDRIDSDDHYWFWNCRFVEMVDNRRGKNKT